MMLSGMAQLFLMLSKKYEKAKFSKQLNRRCDAHSRYICVVATLIDVVSYLGFRVHSRLLSKCASKPLDSLLNAVYQGVGEKGRTLALLSIDLVSSSITWDSEWRNNERNQTTSSHDTHLWETSATKTQWTSSHDKNTSDNNFPDLNFK